MLHARFATYNVTTAVNALTIVAADSNVSSPYISSFFLFFLFAQYLRKLLLTAKVLVTPSLSTGAL